jgi:DNA-directed RNA polymerase subunit RPC12/RpoP
MTMRRMKPKYKYDCADCGVGSANDQVIVDGEELCESCAVKRAARVRKVEARMGDMLAEIVKEANK